MNVSEGLAVVFDWIRETNRKIDSQNISPNEIAAGLIALDRIDSVLLVLTGYGVKITNEERTLISEREAAREAKNWSRSDEIRDIFRTRGYELEDTSKGTIVKKIYKPSADS